jgi:large subunit ribosomal protein L21
MYAIVVDGGRQYKVTEGLELEVDYRDLAAGSALEFKRVLAFSDGSSLKLGAPELAGAVVTAKVVGVFQGEKLVIQKFRRRKTYRRRTGHRQLHTRIKIDKIQVG